MKKDCIISICLMLLFSITSFSQEEAEERVYEYATENHQCLKCHGDKYYYYYNDWVERDMKERMNPYFVIDSVQFYESNHWNFRCVDCHSEDFGTFPHPGELRMEPSYECMDCHGGDDHYAKYNFEGIEEQFQESVHSSKHSEEFTCWMCHDPHTYKINARTSEKLVDIIAYDNAICLSCHADVDKYQLLTTAENPNVLDKHDWLPNQVMHFGKVRCIECHTEVNNDMLVAHKVLPKENAVKLCVECHSQNSLLLATLYKFESKEQRNNAGFYNAAMLEESYVIGANRNYYLNMASFTIFFIVIGLIFVHAIFRIILKK